MKSWSWNDKWDLSTVPLDKLKQEWARRTQAQRETFGAGTGRPRSTERCPCGEMTAKRAQARGHHCKAT
jgi:hypothetical protein